MSVSYLLVFVTGLDTAQHCYILYKIWRNLLNTVNGSTCTKHRVKSITGLNMLKFVLLVRKHSML